MSPKLIAALREQLKLDAQHIRYQGHIGQSVTLTGDEWVELLNDGRCRDCDNSGWFYGDKDLGCCPCGREPEKK